MKYDYYNILCEKLEFMFSLEIREATKNLKA